MEAARVQPRILPRDVLDVVIGLPIGLVHVAICAAGPVALVTLSFLGLGWTTEHALLAGALAFIALAVVALGFTVRRLEIDSQGIRFVRILGSPKFLEWAQIDEIAPASRSEVVIHGWLWPIFPPNEATATLTALGHFRIRFGSETRYFPPANPDEFVQFVDQFRRAAEGAVGGSLESSTALPIQLQGHVSNSSGECKAPGAEK